MKDEKGVQQEHPWRSLTTVASGFVDDLLGVGPEQLEPRNANLFLQKKTVGLRREACVRTATGDKGKGDRHQLRVSELALPGAVPDFASSRAFRCRPGVSATSFRSRLALGKYDYDAERLLYSNVKIKQTPGTLNITLLLRIHHCTISKENADERGIHEMTALVNARITIFGCHPRFCNQKTQHHIFYSDCHPREVAVSTVLSHHSSLDDLSSRTRRSL